MQPTNDFYERIQLVQDEVEKACGDAYERELVPQRRLELLTKMQRWMDRLITKSLIYDNATKDQEAEINKLAVELAALVILFVAETKVVTSDQGG